MLPSFSNYKKLETELNKSSKSIFPHLQGTTIQLINNKQITGSDQSI